MYIGIGFVEASRPVLRVDERAADEFRRRADAHAKRIREVEQAHFAGERERHQPRLPAGAVDLSGGLAELRNRRGDVRCGVQRPPWLAPAIVKVKNTVVVETRQWPNMAKGVPQRREAAGALVDSMEADVANGAEAWRRIAQPSQVRRSRQLGHRLV